MLNRFCINRLKFILLWCVFIRTMHVKVTGELTQFLTLIFDCSNSLLYWVTCIEWHNKLLSKDRQICTSCGQRKHYFSACWTFVLLVWNEGSSRYRQQLRRSWLFLIFSENGSQFSNVLGSARAPSARRSSHINRKPHHKVIKLKSK